MQARFVFIAGLHRTGTSLLAKMLAQHPAVSAIAGAPVPEQEGCYLQGAIPHTARHGIPGHYATDPAQHFTEDHPLNTMETRDRLRSDWEGWFDGAKPWWLEKSPVNLTRMRFAPGPVSNFQIRDYPAPSANHGGGPAEVVGLQRRGTSHLWRECLRHHGAGSSLSPFASGSAV